MNNIPLIFAATCDLSGQVRGKAFPETARASRMKKGIGWVPTNSLITCFDTIAPSPFGALGDLILMPDESCEIEVALDKNAPAERLVLGDIHTLDGKPWGVCPRSILQTALDRLDEVAGLKVNAAFEHEFQMLNIDSQPGEGFGYGAFAQHRQFGEALMAAMDTAGIEPDSFLKEYGPSQFEVTNAPTIGKAAADWAVLLRELTKRLARLMGNHVSFLPIIDPEGVGNGVHIHISFLDDAGAPATYNAENPYGMSAKTGAFISGILKYLDSILALTAASDISYMRLTPHRWSAAFNNLGYHDREAAVRICPVTSSDDVSIAKQYNFEFRAADASASPYLAMAALIHAGAQGIEENLGMPEVSQEDLSELSENSLSARGYVRLPKSLGEALDKFEQNDVVRSWFDPQFSEVYLALKRAEINRVAELSDTEKCALYSKVY